ncbi:MAG TPA: hypothetical protein VMU15_07270 [Anaeromyxobacter sp.]|nr:hypothetical protein [Anaeromyxobacter sp.]
MTLTARGTHGYGSPLSVRSLLTRASPLALSLLLACAKAGLQPAPKLDWLHYPAWMAAYADQDQLLVVNIDQDLAFSDGWVTGFDRGSDTPGTGVVLGGADVPNVAGKIMVLDPATAGACSGAFGQFQPPLALVAGRTESALYQIPLPLPTTPGQKVASNRIGLDPFSAAEPYGLAYTCGADLVPRAWVGFQAGAGDVGYVSQVDLRANPITGADVVEVNVGIGTPRSFAYDAAHDRLYFTGKEYLLRGALRWIDVGQGCKTFDGGVQDESQGGCHVDVGWDLGAVLRGAEPNEIQLSSDVSPCTAGGYTGDCRRAYISVRIYDADLAHLSGTRPSSDIGGMLWVVELPEGGLGRPDPQVVQMLDVGVTAGDVHVIPRAGQRDLVAVTVLDDGLLWLYDDESGTMVKVIGSNAVGLPPLGHKPTAIVSKDLGNGVVRLFVSSFEDHFVTAVDVPVADPSAAQVATGTDGNGNVVPLRWKGNTP